MACLEIVFTLAAIYWNYATMNIEFDKYCSIAVGVAWLLTERQAEQTWFISVISLTLNGIIIFTNQVEFNNRIKRKEIFCLLFSISYLLSILYT